MPRGRLFGRTDPYPHAIRDHKVQCYSASTTARPDRPLGYCDLNDRNAAIAAAGTNMTAACFLVVALLRNGVFSGCSSVLNGPSRGRLFWICKGPCWVSGGMSKMHGNTLRFGPETAIGPMKNRFDSHFYFSLNARRLFFAALFSASLAPGRGSRRNLCKRHCGCNGQRLLFDLTTIARFACKNNKEVAACFYIWRVFQVSCRAASESRR